MQSGTIELESGKWHWTIIPQWTGSTVVYQHRERVHDEMRSWVQELELTSEEAHKLALDPLERTWMDADGLKWRLTLELPVGWRRLGSSSGGECPGMSLIFKRGGIRRVAEVPGSTKLGGLSNKQLRGLLEEASRDIEHVSN